MLLALAVGVAALPLVISQGEEDGLLADLEEERGNGSSLLDDTSTGDTVAGTGRGPASLKDTGLLAGADSVDNVELATDKGTSIGGNGLGVEVSVGLSTDNVNDIAESVSGGRLLPDTNGVGGGEGTSVARELRLALSDEVSELRGGTVSVEDGLVGNDDQVNEIPLGPRADGANLLGNGGVGGGTVSSVNVDSKDHLHAVVSAGTTDVGQGVAVSRVDTDGRDTESSDSGNVLGNSVAGLAATRLIVGSVGDGPGGNTVSGQTTSGGGGGSRAGSGAGSLGGGNGGGSSRGGRVDRDSGGRGSSAGGGRRDVKGAVDDGAGVDNGGDDLGLGVSARAVGADNGDNNRGRGGHGSGRGSNGVSTSRGADVGGGLDDAGDDGTAGGDGGVRAGHGGGRLDDGGDTTQGVSTGRDRGGRGGAHGGCLTQSDRGGGEGVDTRGRAGLSNGGGHNDGRRGGGRGGRGHRLGAARGDAARDGGNAARGSGGGAGRGRVVHYGRVLIPEFLLYTSQTYPGVRPPDQNPGPSPTVSHTSSFTVVGGVDGGASALLGGGVGRDGGITLLLQLGVEAVVSMAVVDAAGGGANGRGGGNCECSLHIV